MGIFDRFKKGNKKEESSKINLDKSKDTNNYFETFSAITDSVVRENRMLYNNSVVYQNILTDQTKKKRSFYNNIKPQYLNVLYKSVPLHQSIINFYTEKLLENFKFEYKDKDYIDLKKFLNVTIKKKSNFDDFNDFLKDIIRDYLIHGNLYFKINTRDNNVQRIEKFNTERMRIKADMDFNVIGYVYNRDWVYQTGNIQKEFNKYEGTHKDGISIMSYHNRQPDFKVYGEPDYISALKWLELAANTSKFHLDNMINGIYPSIILSVFQRLKTNEEREKFKENIESLKDDGKKVAVLTPDIPENAPKVERLNANGVDKEFLRLAEDVDRQICYSHNIDPAIMGMRVAGSLGQGQEIEFVTKEFDKRINKYRNDVSKIINKFLKITNNENIKFKYDN